MKFNLRKKKADDYEVVTSSFSKMIEAERNDQTAFLYGDPPYSMQGYRRSLNGELIALRNKNNDLQKQIESLLRRICVLEGNPVVDEPKPERNRTEYYVKEWAD